MLIECETETKRTLIKLKKHELSLKIATIKEEKGVVEAVAQKLAKEFDNLPEEVKVPKDLRRLYRQHMGHCWRSQRTNRSM